MSKPQLLHCYFEDQARPIGAGWRWVFVKEGTKWVALLDPWNRYTVNVRLAPSRGQEDIDHRTWQSVGKGQSPTTPAMLSSAKRALRRRVIEGGEGATAFEAECLSVK